LKASPILLVSILLADAFAVGVNVVYTAPYGVDVGQYGYDAGHSMDENYSIPRSYFCTREWILVDDIHNERLQLYHRRSEEHSIICRKQSIDINMASSRDSVIWGRSRLIRIMNNGTLATVATYGRRKGEVYAALFLFPSGTKVLETNYARYIFSADYQLLAQGAVPSVMIKDNVICFDSCTIVQSKCFTCLREHYVPVDSTWQPERIAPYSLPDSSEWGMHFEGLGDKILRYLGADKDYRSYWGCNTDSKDEVEGRRQAVFAYDSKGTLDYWFVEPQPSEGWSYSTDRVNVSHDGAVTRMMFYTRYTDFHRRIPKSAIDTTKGIRIVEYIPDEMDKSHEGRVKRYGGGEKR
jgi:hypothetical protein